MDTPGSSYMSGANYTWKMICTDGLMPDNSLFLPEKYRPVALKRLHDEMGHVGTESGLNLARE